MKSNDWNNNSAPPPWEKDNEPDEKDHNEDKPPSDEDDVH